LVNSTPEEQALTNNPYYRATGLTAVTGWFKNYFNFTGRSTRAEFWWMYLVIFLIEIVCKLVSSLVPGAGIALMVVTHVPWLALMTRRYRDAGVPGYLAIVQALANWALAAVAAVVPLDWFYSNRFWFLSFLVLNNLVVFIVTLLPSRQLSTAEAA
jgi:uncharacterized membrane protein YhaH (DUF805 family)